MAAGTEEQEATWLARIGSKSPFVPQVVAWGVEQGSGRQYLVEEYAEEGTMHDLVEWCTRCGTRYYLPNSTAPEPAPGLNLPEDALRWQASRLVLELARMHDAGLMHRDIKAPNVLLGRGGVPLLADVGMAVPINASGRVLDAAGAVDPHPPGEVGTYGSMAPEVAGNQPYDARADIWGTGRLLAALAVGYAYAGSISRGEDYAWPEECEGSESVVQFQGLVTWMLAADPAARPSWGPVMAHPWWGGLDWEALAHDNSRCAYVDALTPMDKGL